jgi:hypothetical protein
MNTNVLRQTQKRKNRMIHRAIIEIQITKSENDDRFEKIKAEGMD